MAILNRNKVLRATYIHGNLSKIDALSSNAAAKIEPFFLPNKHSNQSSSKKLKQNTQNTANQENIFGRKIVIFTSTEQKGA